MVCWAQRYGIKPTARAFKTTPKTVRKWLKRFREQGYRGLEDLSRAPKNPRVKISPQQRQRVLELGRRFRSWGAQRLKRTFGLELSEKAIRRIWAEEGLLKKPRRKHRRRRDLRHIKASLRPFEELQMDTKYLDDIPEYWVQMRRCDLPRFQWTLRDRATGALWVFWRELAHAYGVLFARLVLEHFRGCGVELSGCVLQTDNGSEFIGSWSKKGPSAFTLVVESFQMVHRTIPPGRWSFQADVETANRLMEVEFYEVEVFRSRREFLEKAQSYQLWFNFLRKNSWRGWKTPWEILHEREPTLPEEVLWFPPIYLDELYIRILDKTAPGGYDVIPWASFPPKAQAMAIRP